MGNFLGLNLTVFLGIMGIEYGREDVYSNFSFCEAFIEESSFEVPTQCCNGLANLNYASKTEYGGPQRICQCIENIPNSGSHFLISESRISDLYYRCNIHLNFPISEHMDCSR